MGVLNAEGQDNARFVGGCVRNALMGCSVDDIDVATVLMPEDVIERCENAGIAVVPTGLKHGTVTAIWRKKTFEITTLRKDVETDGRHAVVLYTDDWQMDAEELIQMVSSPNGTTVAGREVLESSDLKTVIEATIQRATQRSRELGQ